MTCKYLTALHFLTSLEAKPHSIMGTTYVQYGYRFDLTPGYHRPQCLSCGSVLPVHIQMAADAHQ